MRSAIAAAIILTSRIAHGIVFENEPHREGVADLWETPTEDLKMDITNLGDALGARRRRRKKSRGMGALPTLVGRRRKGRKGARKGRKICIRTSTGKKACGVRWRKRRRK